MFETPVFQFEDLGTPEEKLWRAVIARTLEEWIRGPLRYSQKAEQFLFHDKNDFELVCSSAGINPIHLREKLQFIRAKATRKSNASTGATRPDAQRRLQPGFTPQLVSGFVAHGFRRRQDVSPFSVPAIP